MGDAADLFPRAKTPRHGVQCRVITAPDDATDRIDVEWDADGDDGAGEEQVPELGVPWASNGLLPVEGDMAILFNDDRGDPHALVFATGDPTGPDSTADVAALDLRVDALTGVNLSTVIAVPGVSTGGYALPGVPAGHDVFITTVVGASHWFFRWYPAAGSIVIVNTDAAQDVTVHYRAMPSP